MSLELGAWSLELGAKSLAASRRSSIGHKKHERTRKTKGRDSVYSLLATHYSLLFLCPLVFFVAKTPPSDFCAPCASLRPFSVRLNVVLAVPGQFRSAFRARPCFSWALNSSE